jgi:preprotein translocase SecF subunit
VRFIKHQTHFDFVGTRRVAYWISGLLILAGIVSMAIKGGPRYGIDFTGGLALTVDLAPKVSLQKLHDSMIQNQVDSIKAGTAIALIYRAETVASVKKTTTPANPAVPAVVDTTTAKADSVVVEDKVNVANVAKRFPDLATKYAAPDKVAKFLQQAGVQNPESYIQQLTGSVKTVDSEMLRDAMKKDGIKGAEIQDVQIPGVDGVTRTGFQIRLTKQEGMKDKVIETIQKNFPETITDNQRDYIVSSDEIGAKIGKELRDKAILAVVFSCLIMIVYIWVRFRFTYGIAAVIALVHDVLTTMAMFSLLNLEIDLTVIAAILTLVGYSINDTIVVFDRIRENIRLYRKKTLPEIFNESINETLSRTIITSLTVFIVVLILWLFGGSVIHNFSFALLFGVITGTYSSIYIASPIVIEYYQWSEKKKEKQKQALKGKK